MNTLSEAPIYIDDASSLTITELRTKARRMKTEVGIDLVIVDYLQLMHAPAAAGKDGNRVQEVSAITRGLKALARELNTPLIALSQLNRSPEARTDGEPRLSDLRESGSIEQDADMVMFLWKKPAAPDDHGVHQEGEVVNLKLAKHRNGPTGDMELWFRKNQTRFYALDDKR
jgi:replicative DNA helicase